MARVIDLRRHTDNDGDVLSEAGVAAAVAVGRGLQGRFHVAVSSGAQRATQTVACLLAAHTDTVPAGAVVEPGLRSEREDEWRDAYSEAGSGELAALRDVAPALVAAEAEALGAALRRVLDRLGDGQRALVVGHSPTSEAAVLGLTGQEIGPLGKGEGVRVTAADDGFEVTPLR